MFYVFGSLVYAYTFIAYCINCLGKLITETNSEHLYISTLFMFMLV